MSSDLTRRGLLVVVSAPSGAGKTSAVERLLTRCPTLTRSRSYTSRAARPAEVDGVDYNFIERARFEQMAGRGAFLEWAEVFGNLYGTSQDDVEALLAGGVDVVLVIDVQGARQVRSAAIESIGIFVMPPSFAVLERRLRGRSQDSPEAIARRLATARIEVAALDEYDYVVVNDDDDLDRCVTEMAAIIIAERARLERRRPSLVPILDTFVVHDNDNEGVQKS